MRLVLIRHTSVDVPPGVCYGQTDVNVKESFPEEAAIVKANLQKYKFDAVYSSPLQRCVKLAAACGYEHAEKDDRLKELNFGDWEMKAYSEIKDPRLFEWFTDYINVSAPGGESVIDQQKRFKDFVEHLRERHGNKETIAIFTHGGIVMNGLVSFGGKTFDEVYANIPEYGSISEIEI